MGTVKLAADRAVGLARKLHPSGAARGYENRYSRRRSRERGRDDLAELSARSAECKTGRLLQRRAVYFDALGRSIKERLARFGEQGIGAAERVEKYPVIGA
jgi:hypothetical protein